jgi:hypothetical protein
MSDPSSMLPEIDDNDNNIITYLSKCNNSLLIHDEQNCHNDNSSSGSTGSSSTQSPPQLQQPMEGAINTTRTTTTTTASVTSTSSPWKYPLTDSFIDASIHPFCWIISCPILHCGSCPYSTGTIV